MLPKLTPSDLTALINETLEFAYPVVEVEGEVKSLKVSRGKWLYFDIADEESKIRCFGTVYSLPGPVEDGMLIKVIATPRLHSRYGFSLSISSISLSGEGSIKKGADLLKQKLEKEGLFAGDRKRPVPYPPSKIGLITSSESAAYQDFLKVSSARMGGIDIFLADVQVQGNSSPSQIVSAIDWFNTQFELVDVIVIIRGGGGIDDLQSFSDERVVRAVAGSRIPTAVAIGHESDLSLSEMASDLQGSTPSNIAEMLVPDRKELSKMLSKDISSLNMHINDLIEETKSSIYSNIEDMSVNIYNYMSNLRIDIAKNLKILETLNPKAVLRRGYSIVRHNENYVRSVKDVKAGDVLGIEMYDGNLKVEVSKK